VSVIQKPYAAVRRVPVHFEFVALWKAPDAPGTSDRETNQTVIARPIRTAAIEEKNLKNFTVTFHVY
jgi:hypothetical protein